MDEKTIDKVTILAKLCAISEIQVRLIEDKKELEAELAQIEKDERKDNHH